jgi:hypothetical protein
MFPFLFLSAPDIFVLNEIFLCFSMDLSWNYATESQAYDRVHRLGQEKDVIVKRLVVENTIEERMLRLQEVKMGTCIDTHPLFLIRY